MNRDREAIAPCPFCGSAGKLISTMGLPVSKGYGPSGSRIVCSNDECSGCGGSGFSTFGEFRELMGDEREAVAAAEGHT